MVAQCRDNVIVDANTTMVVVYGSTGLVYQITAIINVRSRLIYRSLVLKVCSYDRHATLDNNVTPNCLSSIEIRRINIL